MLASASVRVRAGMLMASMCPRSFGLEVERVYDLTGPSGAGRSMLLQACAQMMPVEGGRLLLSVSKSVSKGHT